MAFIDRRSKAKVYQDGSSLVCAGLTEANAQAAIDSNATAGWYPIGYLAGGNLGRDNDAQEVRDETGLKIATTTTRDDWTIQNTTQQTDAVTLAFLKWLEANEVPIRYELPTPDPDVVQVHYHPAMSKDVGGDQISTQKGVRSMQFTLRGDEDRHVFADVAADQSDWATNGLGDALDNVFAPA